MAKLKQSENGYSIYLGWYGIHAQNKDKFELRLYPEIKSVYKIDSSGTQQYSFGYTELFQPFTKLEIGNCYIILLNKGNSIIDIPNFVDGTTEELKLVLENEQGMINQKPNSNLYELQQNENSFAIHTGWYGLVDNNICENTDYDFTQNENIAKVYYFSNGVVAKSYDRSAPDWANTLTKMEVGKMYYILLYPGKNTITINNFVSSSSIKKLDSNSFFTVRKKTRVFVLLANSNRKKFNDTQYYLGETNENGEQIKSKLKVSDINDLLNKSNYVYPNQPNFEQTITGSVSDYFKALTFDQIDFQFEIQQYNDDGDLNDPDNIAYNIEVDDKTNLSNTSLLKNIYTSAYIKIQEKLRTENKFPKEFDETTKNFENPLTLGIFIHPHAEIRARNCGIDGGDGTRKISFVSILDNYNQNRLEPIGKFIHEIIHSFDLKDLYTSSGIGFSKADPMAYGFWGHTLGSSGKYFPYFPSGYTRYKMTEFNIFNADVIEINQPQKDIELFSPIQKNEIIRVSHPRYPDIWYIDYRTPISNTSSSHCVDYDQELVDSGIMIIHEFPTLFPDQKSYIPCHSRAESGYTVSLEQQDGLFQLQENDRSLAIEFDDADNKSDFFKENDEFSPYTMPSSVSYKGIPTGIKIHNIRNTENGSVLFDLDFVEPPTYFFRGRDYPSEFSKVEFFRKTNDTLIKLRDYANRGKTVPFRTSKKPLVFDFKNSYFKEEIIHVKIETKGISNNTEVALKYKKKNSTEFTTPGDWAISKVSAEEDFTRNPRGYVTFDIPAGLLPIYLQNSRNHIMIEAIDSQIFPWIEFIDVMNL